MHAKYYIMHKWNIEDWALTFFLLPLVLFCAAAVFGSSATKNKPQLVANANKKGLISVLFRKHGEYSDFYVFFIRREIFTYYVTRFMPAHRQMMPIWVLTECGNFYFCMKSFTTLFPSFPIARNYLMLEKCSQDEWWWKRTLFISLCDTFEFQSNNIEWHNNQFSSGWCFKNVSVIYCMPNRSWNRSRFDWASLYFFVRAREIKMTKMFAVSICIRQFCNKSRRSKMFSLKRKQTSRAG